MDRKLILKAEKSKELLHRINTLEHMQEDVGCMAEIRMWSSQDHIDRCTTISSRDGELFINIKSAISRSLTEDMHRCERELREIFEPNHGEKKICAF